jgi:hypothetical protein
MLAEEPQPWPTDREPMDSAPVDSTPVDGRMALLNALRFRV